MSTGKRFYIEVRHVGFSFVSLNHLASDIKLQNIFLTAKNMIRVGDFGIARVLKNTLDCAKTVVGTPYYLSPEVCSSQPYDYKTDVWSLGCVLYEMCTLRHAFHGSNIASLVRRILKGAYKPISPLFSTGMQMHPRKCDTSSRQCFD